MLPFVFLLLLRVLTRRKESCVTNCTKEAIYGQRWAFSMILKYLPLIPQRFRLKSFDLSGNKKFIFCSDLRSIRSANKGKQYGKQHGACVIVHMGTLVFHLFAERILLISLQKLHFYVTKNHIRFTPNGCSVEGGFLKKTQVFYLQLL